MKTLYTIKLNRSRQIATIRIYHLDKIFAKYRTLKIDRETFEAMEYFTSNDIKNYLRNNNNYFKIK